MTFRLLGMSEEDRLAFEQATGLKTEAARVIVETSIAETERLLQKTIREVQEVIGPHGSVTRLQAGGVKVSRVGVSVFDEGTLKTTIEQDGDFMVGSDITQPSGTSFVVFVNDQTYNNEQMEQGDLLIGNNSSGVSNVKYDASEGQLQFRQGTTINVYMDTDGSLKAGAGSVGLDSDGITISDGGDALLFADTLYNSYGLFTFKPVFDSSRTAFHQLVFTVENETNQISNGDFETGSFSSWTESDPGGTISVVSGQGYGGGYAALFNADLGAGYIRQNLAAATGKGQVVSLRIKAASGGVVTVSNGTEFENIQVPALDEYRTYYAILSATRTYLQISSPSNTAVYVDEVNTRLLSNLALTPASYSRMDHWVIELLASSQISLYAGWAKAKYLTINNSSGVIVEGGLVVNDLGGDADTRMEGDTDQNLLFLDASTDRVGIGTATPSAKLNVEGDVIFNDTGADKDIRMEGDTEANLFFLDASVDAIGMGTNTPDTNAILDLAGGLKVDSIVNDTGLAHGTWTPTGTTGTNVDSVTPHLMNYIRVGNQVFFNGVVEVDCTAVGAFTCYLSLPIASNFNSANDANGNGTHPGTGVPNIISIREDQVNDRLQLDGYAQVNTNLFYRLAGGYIVK